MKAFVRYGSNGAIVPGTLIKAKVKPTGVGWMEVPLTFCCNTNITFPQRTNSKYKAFIKYDAKGLVVGGSTIIRKVKPKIGTWMEIPYLQCCDNRIVTLADIANLISVAEDSQVFVSEDGSDILPEMLWVETEYKDLLDAALMTASLVDEDSSVSEIRDAYDLLQSALSQYNQNKKPGTKVEEEEV